MICGLGGDDELRDGDGHDTLYGGAGVDAMDGTDSISGNDIVSGGGGTDTCASDAGDTELTCEA